MTYSCFDLDSAVHGSCCGSCINEEADFASGIGNGGLLDIPHGDLTIRYCCHHETWANAELAAARFRTSMGRTGARPWNAFLGGVPTSLT